MAELSERDLVEIEREAVDLATMAGAQITAALGRTLAVRYKSEAEDVQHLRDPVSEVDEDVEARIRDRVASLFPGQDVLGEESEERPGRDHDVVWAIDPIDGTANFVNGFPIFAASIGVLHRGVPVVGAVWCSTSHALRSGVYHARRGGRLSFESDVFEPVLNPVVRRRLIGLGKGADAEGLPGDVRRTGSAAVECAFTAAGLLAATRIETPNIWDVAGGFPLLEAAGAAIRVDTGNGWQGFDGFMVEGGADGETDLRHWRGRVVAGTREIVDALCRRSD
ncbi:inositol monophosphatase family protein [Pseudosulfitobacter koreensis]|uniref:Inositol monophosphatase n=1 Tax=Pseudosulfitobacter koreensis TaxID=2968472 RepID=A0ABT1YZQ2_9RHOB|nr:inositol monophosphatase [Pseudosulfitobacter koreense]MCR8826369.1 inositol monophosphatase [Pseudosulfitobacter koreense]